jgi:hypothetical protein
VSGGRPQVLAIFICTRWGCEIASRCCVRLGVVGPGRVNQFADAACRTGDARVDREIVCAFTRSHALHAPAALSCIASIVFGCVWALASASSADAGSFGLVRGKRYELCREYEKNLRSFPRLSESTGQWPLDPKLLDFKKPQWETVDARQHLDVMKTLFFRNYGPGRQVGSATPEEIWEQHAKAVFDGLADGSVRLERARFDVDNDGHADTVYRYFSSLPAHLRSSWKTRQQNGYWYIYFSDNDPLVAEKFKNYSGFDRFYDSFFFKGRAYLIGWFGQLAISELNTIPQLHDLAQIEVCRFTFSS